MPRRGEIAEGRKQTQAQIAESQRQIEALYQLNAELIRDRATMLEILRGLNEDRIRTSENLASLAENVARIANARFAARRVEGQGRTQAVYGDRFI